LLNDEGSWSPFKERIKKMAEGELLNPGDEDIIKFADSLEEAIALIEENNQRFIAFCHRHNLVLKSCSSIRA